MYGAYRPAEAHSTGIAQFLFPFHGMIPTGVLGPQGTDTRREDHIGSPGMHTQDLAMTESIVRALPDGTDWLAGTADPRKA
jgi:hypothetical protein